MSAFDECALFRIAWITDPHLNHVPASRWDPWCDALRSSDPTALLITGDISDGDDGWFQLDRLTAGVTCPIYFVLGNHDFYGGSVAQTRRRAVQAARESSRLVYLTDSEPIRLADEVYLVGEDGWGDGVIGDARTSPIRLQDFQQIDDLRGRTTDDRLATLRAQGDESADRLRQKLMQVPDAAVTVWVATHVPPYRESCWYEGRIADDQWAPYFVCGRVGECLDDVATRRPRMNLEVLCGHTHHRGVYRRAHNLRVYTGAADYGHPAIEGLIEPGGLKGLAGSA
ncbi:metallophosphoesterase family protein [Crateriforma spongiae]|uniref:metallophosphoesterase family protein n=1 Tax=Crateriforma spongiae TaxID=2724528 RepID=UPI0039AF0C50